MDDATALLVEGVRELVESVGATIEWPVGSDSLYPCAGGAELGGKLLGIGGYRTTAQVRIVVRTSLFGGNPPSEKDRLIYVAGEEADPHTLRITSINGFRGALMVLDCDDPNQGS